VTLDLGSLLKIRHLGVVDLLFFVIGDRPDGSIYSLDGQGGSLWLLSLKFGFGVIGLTLSFDGGGGWYLFSVAW
jgi:hypothetical protein